VGVFGRLHVATDHYLHQITNAVLVDTEKPMSQLPTPHTPHAQSQSVSNAIQNPAPTKNGPCVALQCSLAYTPLSLLKTTPYGESSCV